MPGTMYVVAVGDQWSGTMLYGPFYTFDNAEDWRIGLAGRFFETAIVEIEPV